MIFLKLFFNVYSQSRFGLPTLNQSKELHSWDFKMTKSAWSHHVSAPLHFLYFTPSLLTRYSFASASICYHSSSLGAGTPVCWLSKLHEKPF